MQGSCVVTLGAPNVLLRMEAHLAPTRVWRLATELKGRAKRRRPGKAVLAFRADETFPLWLGLCIASSI